MKMGVKVYYAEISGHKEVKKRQQRVMMILESKLIPYEAIDITEAGKEDAKEFMMKNAKPRGDSKFILSPQIFNEEEYCGDYDDFDLANENDVLESFLNTPKVERKFSLSTTQVSNNNSQNGGRESSAEAEAKPELTPATITNGNPAAESTEASSDPVVAVSSDEPQTSPITTTQSSEQEVSSTTIGSPDPPAVTASAPAADDDEDLGVGDETEDPEEDDEGNSQVQK